MSERPRRPDRGTDPSRMSTIHKCEADELRLTRARFEFIWQHCAIRIQDKEALLRELGLDTDWWRAQLDEELVATIDIDNWLGAIRESKFRK